MQQAVFCKTARPLWSAWDRDSLRATTCEISQRVIYAKSMIHEFSIVVLDRGAWPFLLTDPIVLTWRSVEGQGSSISEGISSIVTWGVTFANEWSISKEGCRTMTRRSHVSKPIIHQLSTNSIPSWFSSSPHKEFQESNARRFDLMLDSKWLQPTWKH